MRKERGLFFDSAAFLGNLFLVPYLIEMLKNPEGFSRGFGFFLVAAVLAYGLGVCAKAPVLRQRLGRAEGETEPAMIWYLLLFVLFVMHWGLFLACMSYGMEELGLDMSDNLSLPLFFIGGSVPTILTVIALIPSQKDSLPACYIHSTFELVGDLLILFSLIVIFAFWEGLFVESLVGKGHENLLLSLLLVILVSVPFSMFYLAPRIPFLVEDYKKRNTWIQIFLVVAPLAYRLIMPD